LERPYQVNFNLSKNGHLPLAKVSPYRGDQLESSLTSSVELKSAKNPSNILLPSISHRRSSIVASGMKSMLSPDGKTVLKKSNKRRRRQHKVVLEEIT